MTSEATTKHTEHPHIVMTPGTCGGRARIEGTRIAVDFIARFLESGTDAEHILEMYPHLSPAGVYDAISYYYDHKEAVDEFNRENTLEKAVERGEIAIDDDGVVTFTQLSKS